MTHEQRNQSATKQKEDGMRKRSKRTQREEVRRILAAVRAELAAQKQYDLEPGRKRPVVHLDEIIQRARQAI
jgi:hypothetical protein